MAEFKFKRFSVHHDNSSIKVGVDGVLIGAWAKIGNHEKILDLGTGCGLIALMCAQRTDNSEIVAIDIHEPSVNEAAKNFMCSPWSNRLSARLQDFKTLDLTEKFNRIITNPPFFNSGVTSATSSRLCARHQVNLSLSEIIRLSLLHLEDNGTLSMIFPTSEYKEVEETCLLAGCDIIRIVYIQGHEKAPYKRVMLEIGKNCPDNVTVKEYMTLNNMDRSPTNEYRDLCKDFYLYF